MAYTFTLVPDTTDTENMRMYDVSADAADVAGVQAHGLPFTPEYVIWCPTNQAGAFDDPPWMAWDATNITLTKQGIAAIAGRIIVGRSV